MWPWPRSRCSVCARVPCLPVLAVHPRIHRPQDPEAWPRACGPSPHQSPMATTDGVRRGKLATAMFSFSAPSPFCLCECVRFSSICVGWRPLSFVGRAARCMLGASHSAHSRLNTKRSRIAKTSQQSIDPSASALTARAPPFVPAGQEAARHHPLRPAQTHHGPQASDRLLMVDAVAAKACVGAVAGHVFACLLPQSEADRFHRTLHSQRTTDD